MTFTHPTPNRLRTLVQDENGRPTQAEYLVLCLRAAVRRRTAVVGDTWALAQLTRGELPALIADRALAWRLASECSFDLPRPDRSLSCKLKNERDFLASVLRHSRILGRSERRIAAAVGRIHVALVLAQISARKAA